MREDSRLFIRSLYPLQPLFKGRIPILWSFLVREVTLSSMAMTSPWSFWRAWYILFALSMPTLMVVVSSSR